MASLVDSPTQRTPRATIEDVAVAAGVSVATVSRALRGLPNVAISTRERVRAIATEMSYRADPAASRLATGRSRMIGVVVPGLSGWYFSNVVAGVEAVCSEHGYDTAVFGISNDEQRQRLVSGSDAVHRRVDALIFVDISLTEDDLEQIGQQGIETMMIGSDCNGRASVGIDDVEVGRIATRHLLDLGHRRIAVLLGQPEDPFNFDVPHRRRLGYEEMCVDRGIEIDESLFISGNFSVQGGYEALGVLLDRTDPPTAVFALSDEMAFGVLHAAREHGLDVPGELSVIGVDDHEVSEVVGLTTVHQDVPAHGAHAARVILDGLDGRDVAGGRQNAAVRLITRQTTTHPTTRR